jgi:acid stress-induced BolA-like protein IbaG/YrbA
LLLVIADQSHPPSRPTRVGYPTVRVASDDNHHFEALVIAEEFEGKRPLARHQLVYRCLGSLVGSEIHALSIRAMTPAEWQQASGSAV